MQRCEKEEEFARRRKRGACRGRVENRSSLRLDQEEVRRRRREGEKEVLATLEEQKGGGSTLI